MRGIPKNYHDQGTAIPGEPENPQEWGVLLTGFREVGEGTDVPWFGLDRLC